MNKEVVIIGGGILGGMVSNGASTLLPQSESPLLNIGIAGASIFGVTKVKGTTTKDNLLKGALIGSALVQSLMAVQKIANKYFAPKITGTGKVARFAKGAMGLACPHNESGLNGHFMGADGNIYQIDETGGLNGLFMDEAGNVFEMDEEQLNGAIEDELYQQNGLKGAAVLEELY